MVKNNSVLAEIFILNLNGINPKINKQKIKLKTLGETVSQSDIEIPFFVVCETHLKDYILDAEVSITDYNLTRADRPNSRRKGGVAIYSHHTFSLEEIQTFSNSFCELIIAYNKENNIVLVALYRPPDTPADKFRECLDKIKAYKEKYETATTLILGDLNLKYID